MVHHIKRSFIIYDSMEDEEQEWEHGDNITF